MDSGTIEKVFLEILLKYFENQNQGQSGLPCKEKAPNDNPGVQRGTHAVEEHEVTTLSNHIVFLLLSAFDSMVAVNLPFSVALSFTFSSVSSNASLAKISPLNHSQMHK